MRSKDIVQADAGGMPVELFDPQRFALLFDVDGTLLDIAPKPQAVRVPPDLRRHLEQISALADGAVALVSGRPLGDLDRLFELPKLAAVGGHGAEIRTWLDGRPQYRREPPLEEGIRYKLAAIQAIDSRLIIEDKGYSVALHYRLAPEREQAVRDAVARLGGTLSFQGLEVLHGKAVIEVRRPGIDKGSAVRALMAKAPFKGRRPVYIGDDVTDEDAFAALPDFEGIAISVGRKLDGVAHYFDSPSDVRRWIAELCEQNNRSGASAA
jgi:trehalose 6-phosphate phosphatase